MLMPPMRSALTPAQGRVHRGRGEAQSRGATARRAEQGDARNARFLRKTLGDPMMHRFRWAMHTPETLVLEFGCTKLEVSDRLDRMWSELARVLQFAAEAKASRHVVGRDLAERRPRFSGPALN